MIIINVEQRSDAWYAERLGRFTASRFSTLMSGKSTKGYKDLITEIAGEMITGEGEESYTNAIMERGKELEPLAREAYENEMEVKVDEVGFCVPDNDLEEWLGVSPDGMVGRNIIEIKCPLRKTHINYILNNKLPNEYKWQVQGQLFVTGAEWCDFVSYYPNMKLFIVRVFPDLDMHEQLETRIDEAIEDVRELLNKYNEYNYDNE